MIQFDCDKQIYLYDYKIVPSMKQNLKGTQPEVEQEMTKKIKALIQQYLEYMTSEELVINKP